MMAPTNASMAALTIQRIPGGGKGWVAIAGKLMVGSATSLDILVDLLTSRHGPIIVLLHTAHLSKPTNPSTRAHRASRAKK